MISEKSLNILYSKIRQNHSCIALVDNKVIDSFQKDLERRPRGPGIYIVATLSVIFLAGSLPIVVVKGYRFINGLPLQYLDQQNYLNSHAEVTVASILVLAAVIIYVFLPFLFLKQERHLITFKKTNINYVVYFSTLTYLVGFLALIFLNSYPITPEYVTKALTIIWFMVPVVILSFLPALVFAVLVTIIGFGVGIRGSVRSDPAFIIFELLELLEKLDELREPSELGPGQKQELIDRIARIAFKMRSMYLTKGKTGSKFEKGVTTWAIEQMHQAGDNFERLSSWVYFPQPGTLDNLKDRICLYLNVFLSGHYHDLPREEVDELKGIVFNPKTITRTRKFVDLLMFTLYMGLPIAGFATIVSVLHLNIPPLIQSALSLLYIIWAVLGFISFSEKFAPEARQFLMDTIRAVLQRN